MPWMHRIKPVYHVYTEATFSRSAGVGYMKSQVENDDTPLKFIYPDGIGSSQKRKRIRDVWRNAAHQYPQETDNCNRMFSG